MKIPLPLIFLAIYSLQNVYNSVSVVEVENVGFPYSSHLLSGLEVFVMNAVILLDKLDLFGLSE